MNEERNELNSPSGSLPDAEALAKRFHETYERLAPQYAYKTQASSAVDWAEVPQNNKRLMIAVCAEILAENNAITELADDQKT